MIHRGKGKLPVAAWAGALVLTTAAAPMVAPVRAQSTLERSPNLPGAWVGDARTLYLDVVYRDHGDGPADQTFLLGYGAAGYAFLGVGYAPDSPVVAGEDAEWEVVGRFSPLSTAVGASFDFGLTAAWNGAAGSLDTELTLGLPLGPATVTGAARRLGDAFGSGDSRWALGAGGRLRLHPRAALAADVVRPTSKRAGERAAWGAALQLAIPSTPATLSLQAANTRSATLQGSSVGTGATRWGVEINLPLTPSRYFGSGGIGAGGPRTGDVDLVAGDTVRISLGEAGFGEARTVVRPGTYVYWVNEGTGVHGSTSDGGLWDSRFLAPGETYGRVFTEVGEHVYRCPLHRTVEAVVVVVGGRSPD